MDSLPALLGIAVLLPLFSFFVLLTTQRWLRPAWGGYIATGAIVSSGVLSVGSLAIWLAHHGLPATEHHTAHTVVIPHVTASPAAFAPRDTSRPEGHPTAIPADSLVRADAPSHAEVAQNAANHALATPLTGDYYLLGQFGKLRITISYYIDALTLVMFCMVSLIASCIHFYSMGYMHEEEHHVTDCEVILRDGSHLKRRGRYACFFQYMSLFCFSMLGLVLAGNVAMVFVFWELVGICSYFLIGFYVERKSASNAANKAFIVNRIGDFGMLIGLMAIWTGLGTFAFGDVDSNHNGSIERGEQGIFSQVRPGEHHHELVTPAGMMLASSPQVVAHWVRQHPEATSEETDLHWADEVERWRADCQEEGSADPGYWLLIVAGIGIFCGCVGKSAQFPLHVWLPDAMEGPTPVSALVHSATMVAAGVYLVGRFYPVFAPEVLLVIAVIGVITLFMAATIAITATDIKRVLAYSTVSQLGYMMLALGVGGWLAGMMHLVTHAFFKSLLFLCSGSVIHAVHSNEMTDMGGLRKKMPITAATMLVGCLAISGLAIPFVFVGLSGHYSKDLILEQAFSFWLMNRSPWGGLFFIAAAGGAAITTFYMFRLWFMTFAGRPRDARRYARAHESPRVMCIPLIVLALFAVGVAWKVPFSSLSLQGLLEQARPVGTAVTVQGSLIDWAWPSEHLAHLPENHQRIVAPVAWLAFFAAIGGMTLAMAMYWFGVLKPDEVRRQFSGIYRFLRHKWWFDELYDCAFVRPTHLVSRLIARFDRRWIDWLLDTLASVTVRWAKFWEWLLDKKTIDSLGDSLAEQTYRLGMSLRSVQTGSLRQYVLFLVIGLIAVFLIMSLLMGETVSILN